MAAHIWSTSFGGTEWDDAVRVVIDAQTPGLVVLGNYGSESASFGGPAHTNQGTGNFDIFLTKFDLDGTHLWSKSYGGTGSDSGHGLATSADGSIFVSGSFSSTPFDIGGATLGHAGSHDAFLGKIDASGNHVWSKSFGGTVADSAEALAVDNEGNVAVVGSYQSSSINLGGATLTNASVPSSDIFLGKFSSGGTHIWSKSFGGNQGDYGSALAFDSAGNLYLFGTIRSTTITFGGAVLTNTGGLDSYDLYLAKFDPSGNHLWSKSFGDDSAEGAAHASSLALAPDGNLLLTGRFKSAGFVLAGTPLTNNGNNTNDIFLAKFDTSGNGLWAKSFGGTDDDYAEQVAVDNSNAIVLFGSVNSTSVDFGGSVLSNATPGDGELYVAKFDSDGGHIWSLIFEGTDWDFVGGGAVDATGFSYAAVGFMSPTINFGGDPLVNLGSGSADPALFKLAP